jgi:hypothetical protein
MRRIYTKYDAIPHTVLALEFVNLIPEAIDEDSWLNPSIGYKTISYRMVRSTNALAGCKWVDYEMEK